MPLENTGPECFWSAAQDHWAITAHVPATGMVKKVTTIPDSLKGGTKRQISYQGGARAPGAPPQVPPPMLCGNCISKWGLLMQMLTFV